VVVWWKVELPGGALCFVDATTTNEQTVAFLKNKGRVGDAVDDKLAIGIGIGMIRF
jgi:hypothetical protein